MRKFTELTEIVNHHDATSALALFSDHKTGDSQLFVHGLDEEIVTALCSMMKSDEVLRWIVLDAAYKFSMSEAALFG